MAKLARWSHRRRSKTWSHTTIGKARCTSTILSIRISSWPQFKMWPLAAMETSILTKLVAEAVFRASTTSIWMPPGWFTTRMQTRVWWIAPSRAYRIWDPMIVLAPPSPFRTWRELNPIRSNIRASRTTTRSAWGRQRRASTRCSNQVSALLARTCLLTSTILPSSMSHQWSSRRRWPISTRKVRIRMVNFTKITSTALSCCRDRRIKYPRSHTIRKELWQRASAGPLMIKSRTRECRKEVCRKRAMILIKAQSRRLQQIRTRSSICWKSPSRRNPYRRIRRSS